MPRSSSAGPTPRRGWALLVASLTLLICLGVAEVALRWLWGNPFTRESSDLLVKLRLHHPQRDLRIDRSDLTPDSPYARLRTNELGYIEPVGQHPEPDVTVAFLGGSTTECVAVTEHLRFPALVSTLLTAQGIRANTINAGFSGNMAHDSVNVLLNRMADDPPDVAVLMHATNDIAVLYRGRGSYAWRGPRELTRSDFTKWMLLEASTRSALVGLLRSATTLYWPARSEFDDQETPQERAPVDPAPFALRLRAFIGLARAMDVVPVLMTQPTSNEITRYTPKWVDFKNQTRFNDVARRVGAEEAVVVIDLVEHLKAHVPDWDAPMKVYYDGVHLTDHGSQIYATHITEVLQRDVLPGLPAPGEPTAE